LPVQSINQSINQSIQGAASPFGPYIALLPASFDVPLFWTPRELKVLQDASPAVFSKVKKKWS
jgi:hypothetical protein